MLQPPIGHTPFYPPFVWVFQRTSEFVNVKARPRRDGLIARHQHIEARFARERPAASPSLYGVAMEGRPAVALRFTLAQQQPYDSHGDPRGLQFSRRHDGTDRNRKGITAAARRGEGRSSLGWDPDGVRIAERLTSAIPLRADIAGACRHLRHHCRRGDRMNAGLA